MNHELNAQVAEEVMGWIVQRWPVPPIYVTEIPPDGEDWAEAWLPIPDFSGSLDAAWQMEEEIKRRGANQKYVVKLTEALRVDQQWLMSHGKISHGYWLVAHATPEQRCKAALEAVREK